MIASRVASMVRMVDVALPRPAARGIGRHDNVRLGSPDPARNLPAQIEGRHQGTVVVAEKEHVLHAQLRCRRPLLGVADLGQAFGGHRRVAAATVAISKDEVGDLTALFRPSRHRAGGAELGVVRMRHHHEHAVETVRRVRHQAGVGIAVETS
jgi:hypothetical protein